MRQVRRSGLTNRHETLRRSLIQRSAAMDMPFR